MTLTIGQTGSEGSGVLYFHICRDSDLLFISVGFEMFVFAIACFIFNNLASLSLVFCPPLIIYLFAQRFVLLYFALMCVCKFL